MKKIFSYILYSFYTLILIGLALLFIAPPLPGFNALEVKIVKSGSMEPNIMTGAVVVVQEAQSYKLSDVITFTSEGANIPTTHRIIGTEMLDGQEYFVTKGDANEERDTNLVSTNDILGKVVLDLPYVGFVLDFARQPIGFTLLIGLPALLIIIDEFDSIWRESRRIRNTKITKDTITPLVIAPYVPEENKPKVVLRYNDIRPKMAVMTIVLVVLAGQWQWGDSLAYPTDIEASTDNYLEAQALDFTVSPSSSTFNILDGLFTTGDTLDVAINGESDLAYDVSVDFVSGNIELCGDLSVETEAPLVFSGSLTSLSGAEILFNNPWHLDFSLANSDEYTNGDICTIEILFSGYLASTKGDYGYDDIEKVQLTFSVEESQLVVPETSQFLNTNTEETPELPENENGEGDTEEPVVEIPPVDEVLPPVIESPTPPIEESETL